MAELAAPAGVYPPRSLQLWRTVLNWLSFLFQIFFNFFRFTPFSKLLSFVGISHLPLPSSPPLSFTQLPVCDVLVPEPPLPSLHVVQSCPDYDRLVARDDSNQPPIDTLTVVLDLDETLVCAYETSTLPPSLRNQASEGGLKWFELECVSSDKECEGNPKVNHVTVFERPGLHEFLKQVSRFAELVLFTAGLEGYARPLVDRIDVDSRFSRRLYRPSTVSTEYREHVKDLSCLSRDLCRTVIIDNNPFSFLSQPLNGIPCVPFSALYPDDDQLLEVILPMLKHLSLQKDIRPVLYESFHMPQWFQKQGIPTTVNPST